MRSSTAAAWACATLLAGTAAFHEGPAIAAQATKPTPPPVTRLQIPVEYYKLPSGLKVVLSRDATTPTACT